MNNSIQQLKDLGAGDFAHLDGLLLEHLQGTRGLLASWGASPALQESGLYHAAYGTAGFTESLVSLAQRQKISDIVGDDAELIVYQYCACDREFFWPKFVGDSAPEYRDRFNGRCFYLEDDQLRNFCELTVANEVEIALDNPDFVEKHGKELGLLAKSMELYISKKARKAAKQVFDGH